MGLTTQMCLFYLFRRHRTVYEFIQNVIGHEKSCFEPAISKNFLIMFRPIKLFVYTSTFRNRIKNIDKIIFFILNLDFIFSAISIFSWSNGLVLSSCFNTKVIKLAWKIAILLISLAYINNQAGLNPIV